MNARLRKIIAITICFCFIAEQTAFAQVSADIAGQLARHTLPQDKFRPLHVRYLRYDGLKQDFKLLLDKGDLKNPSDREIDAVSTDLLKFFFIGLSLPNSAFWVNLRPDSPDTIVDDNLAKTDIGRIMLETDLQLKKDVARYTAPGTVEGRQYCDKLGAKIAEIFGGADSDIPTLTRPWIIPDEIIIRETADSAYIYKATLKVMLEQEYIKDSPEYTFKDKRLKELNEHSTALIRQIIIPKLNAEINSSKRYASLRQVYYSLIMAQWFKARFTGKASGYSGMIDSAQIPANLCSREPWSKTEFFTAYRKSFKDGEYNVFTSAQTGSGRSFRSYCSGGEAISLLIPALGETSRNPSGTTISSIPASLDPDANPAVVLGLEVTLSGAMGEFGIVRENQGTASRRTADGGRDPVRKKLMPFKDTPLPHDSVNLLIAYGYVPLVERLQDLDEDVRVAAVQALLQIAQSRPEIGQDIFKHLLGTTLDEEWTVRQETADALGALVLSDHHLEQQRLQTLLHMMKDEDPDVCDSARKSLVRVARASPGLEKELVKQYVDELGSDDWEIRLNAVKMLHLIALSGTDQLVEQLIPMLARRLKEDDDSDVRWAAEEAFCEIIKARDAGTSDTIVAVLMELSDYRRPRAESNVAIKALGAVAGRRPELVAEIARGFIRQLEHEYPLSVPHAVFEELVKISSSNPSLQNEIAEAICGKLSSRDPDLRRAAVKALGLIVVNGQEAQAPDLISRIMERIFDPDSNVMSWACETVGEIARARPELISSEMADRMVEALDIKSQKIFIAVTRLIGWIAAAAPDTIPGIMKRLSDRMSADDYELIIACAKAFGLIAGIKPEAITREIVWSLFEFLGSDNTDLTAVSDALAAIARTRPELALEIVPRSMRSLAGGDWEARLKMVQTLGRVAISLDEPPDGMVDAMVSRMDDPDSDVQRAVISMMATWARSKPELITTRIVTGLLALLNAEYWRNRQGAAQAIGAIVETRPDLATDEVEAGLLAHLDDDDSDVCEALRLVLRKFEKQDEEPVTLTINSMSDLLENVNSEDWSDRKETCKKIGTVISSRDFDRARSDYYVKELMDPAGRFRLSEKDLPAGCLITAYLLEQADGDFGVWLRFRDSADADFSLFTQMLAAAMMEDPSGTMGILQGTTSLGESIQSVEGLLMSAAGFDVHSPVEQWDEVRDLLRFCRKFPSPKIIAHIIVTMKILRQGLGSASMFRSGHDVEELLPEIRADLLQLLNRNIPVLSKRRLAKELSLGNTDQIYRLRAQAIELAETVAGEDTRDGLVGRIRDMIHNQPSPRDLAVVKAYRELVRTDDDSGIVKLGFRVKASDRFSVSRLLRLFNRAQEEHRKEVLEVCDKLIETLEEIYGEENTDNIQAYFHTWEAAVKGHEELKRNISALINAQSRGFTYLELLVQSRRELAALSEELFGEALLSTILLDNRLEILYYRGFNELKEAINFNNGATSAKALRNLLENAGLNGYAREETEAVSAELGALEGKNAFSNQDWLKLYSVCKRVERLINTAGSQMIDEFQEMAETLAPEMGAEESAWVENFSSNMFRSDTIYLLSLALKDAKEAAMKRAGLSGWQVVVTGRAEGRVRFLRKASELGSVKPDEIIVIDTLPSDAPPVTEVAGIITLREDSLLSHPAIRARQHRIPYAVCPDGKTLKEYDGQWVSLDISGEDVVLAKAKETRRGRDPPRKQAKTAIELIPANLKDTSIVVMPRSYRMGNVGNKAYRLHQIPEGLFPGQFALRHFGLSFSFFDQVLNLPENSAIKSRLETLKAQVIADPLTGDVPVLLHHMRSLIQELAIPDEHLQQVLTAIKDVFGDNADLKLFFRSSTNAEDLAGYQAAGLYDSFGNVRPEKEEVASNIKNVWSSIWNERAFYDRQANGVDSNGVYPAILVMEMVMPDYAFVIHTRNPNDSSKNELIFEVVQGLGESLVSGEDEFSGSPYRFSYDRKSEELKLVTFANKSKKLVSENGIMRPALVSYVDDTLLTDKGLALVKAVARAAVKAEAAAFGNRPQDIEGAILLNGEPRAVFLQSRDQPVNADGGDRASSRDPAGATMTPFTEKVLPQDAVNLLMRFSYMPLVEKLNDSDDDVRVAAIKALSLIGKSNPRLAPEIEKRILEHTRDELWGARQEAAIGLGTLGLASVELAPLVISRLISMLKDNDSDVRRAAGNALDSIARSNPEHAEQLISALFEALSSSDSNTRDEAVRILGKIAVSSPTPVTGRIVDRLLAQLKETMRSSRPILIGSVCAIAKARAADMTEQAVSVLLGILDDENSDERAATIEALGEVAVSRPLLAGRIMSRLFSIERELETAIRAMAPVALANPSVRKEIERFLLEKLHDPSHGTRKEVVKAIGAIAAANKESARESVGLIFEMTGDYYPAAADAAWEALSAVSVSSPELITKDMADKAMEILGNGNDSLSAACCRFLGTAAVTVPEATPGLLLTITSGFTNEYSQPLRQAMVSASVSIAGSRPELITMEIVRQLYHVLIAGAKTGEYETAANALGRIASVRPELPRELVPDILRELQDKDWKIRIAAFESLKQIGPHLPGSIRYIIDAALALLDDPEIHVRAKLFEAARAFVSSRPEEITEEIVAMLLAHLDAQSWVVRMAAAQFLGTVAESRADLITGAMVAGLEKRAFDGDSDVRRAVAKTLGMIRGDSSKPVSFQLIAALLFKLKSDEWDERRDGCRNLGQILSQHPLDEERVNYYVKELLDPKGLAGLSEADLAAGCLVTACLLDQDADFGLWLRFRDSAEEDFSLFTALLASSLLVKPAATIRELKEKNTMEQAVAALEEILLASAGLDLRKPAQEWEDIRKWLNFCINFPGERAIAHIIVTMKILREGLGNQSTFRSNTDVESELPKIRTDLLNLLSAPLSILSKRRLVKELSLGNIDQIYRLRRQAIELAEEVTGYDTRSGIVGRIRDNIHNRPSPQDLAVVKAYREFVGKDDASALRRFGFSVDKSDSFADSFWAKIRGRSRKKERERILKACDVLIETLEEIYGEENVNKIQEYFQEWEEAIAGHGELKARIYGLIRSMTQDFGYLEQLVQARKDLAELSKDLRGEALLSTILMDNRLEILYYRSFNGIKGGIDFNQGHTSAKALRNLLENAGLNGYSQEEIAVISGELAQFEKKPGFSARDWLKFYSVCKRVERVLNAASGQTITEFQEMAETFARLLGEGESSWAENFSSNMFRSDTIYLLSLALKDAKEAAMKQAKLNGWQVVVTGKAEGKIRFLNRVAELGDVKTDEIIVIDSIPSDAPPVTEVAGIITLKEDSLLSHPAIRARQHRIPYAVCPEVKTLKEYDGQWVRLDISGEDVVLTKTKETRGGRDPPRKREKAPIELIPADLKDTSIVVMPRSYRMGTVGNKAFRLRQIPEGLFPGQFALRHFGLSFSFFDQVLNLEENKEIKDYLEILKTTLYSQSTERNISYVLNEMRSQIKKLKIPDEQLDQALAAIKDVFGDNADLKLFFRSSTNAEDLAGYQAAGLYDSFGNVRPEKEEVASNIKNVWASIWNDRAFFDRQANGVDSNGVYPAILVMEMVMPDYAFVIHTRNPNDSSKNELIFEVVQGLGESLVSGEEEFSGSPYRFTYDRKTDELNLVTFANKSKKLVSENGKMRAALVSYTDDPLLTDKGLALVKAVSQAAVKIEGEFVTPQDIEGALMITKDAKAVFLQTRDQPVNADGGGRLGTGAPKAAAANPAVTTASKKENTFGGIDFRGLPIVTQAINNLGANMEKISATTLSSVNLGSEWRQIEKLVKSGMTPSAQRLRDYIQLCCFKGTIDEEIHKIIRCISDIMRIEEEKDCSTEPLLKDMLAVLDSAASAPQLTAVFTGAKF